MKRIFPKYNYPHNSKKIFLEKQELFYFELCNSFVDTNISDLTSFFDILTK